ncbi:MAG: folylpolyglutamate synthase/dihydrofolate synthase family protein [Gemmatimonadota bacterium]|nr:folylpolyglutamate synthase/dihydrofolate synthase family protein [Gemmatimonadota bacterium]
MEYSQVVESLYGLRQFGVKLGLGNITSLLERLGKPHLHFTCFHVAGTNGKGTVAAVCQAVLAAHGVKSGLFTSPHLLSIRERIRVDSAAVPREFVTGWVEEHLRFLTSRKITFFEAITALAFDYFRSSAAEAVSVEVGLGGRWDATNVVSPMVTAITSIGMDHEEYLGRSLAAIAAEKAGIVKPEVPLLCAETNRRALSVIERACRELGSPLIRLGQAARLKELSHTPGGVSFDFHSGHFELRQATLSQYGTHQARNAALGLLAAGRMLEALGLKPESAKAIRALRSLSWPGRFQRVLIPGDPQVEAVLDVAHNPPAARKLAGVFKEIFAGRRAIIVAGLAQQKRRALFFRPLTAIAHGFILPRVDFAACESSPSQVAPPELKRYLQKAGAQAQTSPSMTEAMDAALSLARKTGVPILVTGSFRTVGEAMRVLGLDVLQPRRNSN